MMKTFKTLREAKRGKEAKVWHDGIAIYFPFDRDTLAKVKTLIGRKYHGDGKVKYWTCPISLDSIENLIKWGFKIDDELQKTLDRLLKKIDIDVTNLADTEVKGFKKKLRPFQKKALTFIDLNGGRALIADDMGLGKTIEALAWLQLHPKRRPAVVVCPASVKMNWVQEIEQCMTSRFTFEIAKGKTPWRISSNTEIVMINYDILDAWLKALFAWKPVVVIADEAHKFKNNKAARTVSMKSLVKKVKYFIPMTGTPIQNRPMEIYNAVNMVDRTLFPSRFEFGKRYCAGHHDGYGWNFKGASNIEELHKKLTSTIMLRRTKEEVLPELPPKVRSFVPIELNNRKEYSAVERDLVKFINGEVEVDIDNLDSTLKGKPTQVEILAKIEYLKQATIKGKMDSVIEWIRDAIETNGKLVVFAIHKIVIDRLTKEFGDAAIKIDGSVPPSKRQEIVNKFQNDPKLKLFVGNIVAAGEGITLTAACNVAVIELPWTPGALEQAIDRLHRIGQMFCVNVWFLLAMKTIEMDIAQLLDGKKKVVSAVTDGVVVSEESLIAELINKFKQ